MRTSLPEIRRTTEADTSCLLAQLKTRSRPVACGDRLRACSKAESQLWSTRKAFQMAQSCSDCNSFRGLSSSARHRTSLKSRPCQIPQSHRQASRVSLYNLWSLLRLRTSQTCQYRLSLTSHRNLPRLGLKLETMHLWLQRCMHRGAKTLPARLQKEVSDWAKNRLPMLSKEIVLLATSSTHLAKLTKARKIPEARTANSRQRTRRWALGSRKQSRR